MFNTIFFVYFSPATVEWLILVLFSFLVLSKKGRCPIVDESDHNCHRQFVSDCLVDFDCNATAKCCRTACHQYRCVEPGDVKQRSKHKHGYTKKKVEKASLDIDIQRKSELRCRYTKKKRAKI